MAQLTTLINERQYKLLVESIVDYAIYMIDTSGRVVSWNAGAERLKGYTSTEILGEHFSRFYTEEDKSVNRPQYALKVARETGRFHDEGWRVRKDGSRFWALVVLDAIRDEGGELIGFAKITRDMTEKRIAHEALQASEKQFRLLVDRVTDYAIYLISPEGLVSSWNRGAQRIKGYTADEVIGKHFSIFYRPEDRAAQVPQRALATARHEGRFETEGWRVRKDGSRFWASVVIDVVRDDTGHVIGFAKVTRDITERRNAQLRLDERAAELQALSHSLLTSVDDERARLAAELHDELGSQLIAANFDVMNLQNQMAGSAPALLTQLEQIRELLVSANVLNRRIMEKLSPSILEMIGLGRAIQTLCESHQKKTGHPCTLTLSGTMPPDMQISLTVYRILQQALLHVCPSGAVDVQLHADSKSLTMTVVDNDAHLVNGVGDIGAVGIAEMKERSARIGGTFDIRPHGNGKQALLETIVPFHLALPR